jgi:pyrroline-5-carboxylate reductase
MASQRTESIGFVGCGQMGSALIQGIFMHDSTRKIFAYDPAGTVQGVNVMKCVSNIEVLQRAEVVFLCVKPQVMDDVLEEMKDHVEINKHLIVSIAAGISIERIRRGIGENARIIRVMPNTPCLVHAGAAALARGSQATQRDADIVREILESVGICFELKEDLLDAVTGLSGSGPAIVFMMIEALADGGVLSGLPRNVAQELAAQTVFGSAKLMIEGKKHPGQLKDSVASPGGTTIQGISVMEDRGVCGEIFAALLAWCDISLEV